MTIEDVARDSLEEMRERVEECKDDDLSKQMVRLEQIHQRMIAIENRYCERYQILDERIKLKEREEGARVAENTLGLILEKRADIDKTLPPSGVKFKRAW